MHYKEIYHVDGIRVRKGYKEAIDERPRFDKKAKVRYKIEKEIFDLHDSVADNAKMISLLTSLVARIWRILPDEYKDKLPENERKTVDYVIAKFESTITWADVQWKLEGMTFADKLLERQAKIGNIIKKVYKVDS